MATRPRNLFGGAITAQLPVDYIDASDLRQVPDTQEVFLSPTDDTSVIFEVLQLVTASQVAGHSSSSDDDADVKALEYHFASIAHDNDAVSSEVLSAPHRHASRASSPGVEGPLVMEGKQKVAKFNASQEQADDVLILVALWRIKSKNTDLVLTVNCPLAKAGNSTEPQAAMVARLAFGAFVDSMQVNDLGLFAS